VLPPLMLPPCVFLPFPALPFLREGKLVGLVTATTTRIPEWPDVPTTLEAGYANADFPVWLGLLAPAKTPRDVFIYMISGAKVRAPAAAMALIERVR